MWMALNTPPLLRGAPQTYSYIYELQIISGVSGFDFQQ